MDNSKMIMIGLTDDITEVYQEHPQNHQEMFTMNAILIWIGMVLFAWELYTTTRDR